MLENWHTAFFTFPIMRHRRKKSHLWICRSSIIGCSNCHCMYSIGCVKMYVHFSSQIFPYYSTEKLSVESFYLWKGKGNICYCLLMYNSITFIVRYVEYLNSINLPFYSFESQPCKRITFKMYPFTFLLWIWMCQQVYVFLIGSTVHIAD